MQVVVTGGAGLIGSHIVDYFLAQGENVTVLDDFSTGKRSNLENSANINISEVDLKNRRDSFKILKEADIIVHLAAKIGGVRYFQEKSADIISENDAMNRTVFDAAEKFDIDRIVYASSSMVYDPSDQYPVSEDQVGEIPPPESAYGFQKLSGEYYCRPYKKQYDVDYTIFRPFNVVGPREYPGQVPGHSHVIPDLVKKIITDKQYPLELIGDGTQIRSFMNVHDLASGVYKCAVEKDAINEDFNLGNPEPIKIVDLAKKVWEKSGRENEIKLKHNDSFEHDVDKRVPDINKAKTMLNWQPEITLNESLEEYISWYKNNV